MSHTVPDVFDINSHEVSGTEVSVSKETTGEMGHASPESDAARDKLAIEESDKQVKRNESSRRPVLKTDRYDRTACDRCAQSHRFCRVYFRESLTDTSRMSNNRSILQQQTIHARDVRSWVHNAHLVGKGARRFGTSRPTMKKLLVHPPQILPNGSPHRRPLL